MINTVLFDMGGTLEDIWYNDETIQTVTRKLLTFLQEHDMVTGSNEISFWNKINSGIRKYKEWSEGNALELKPEEIWPNYYLSEFDLDKEKKSHATQRIWLACGRSPITIASCVRASRRRSRN